MIYVLQCQYIAITILATMLFILEWHAQIEDNPSICMDLVITHLIFDMKIKIIFFLKLPTLAFE